MRKLIVLVILLAGSLIAERFLSAADGKFVLPLETAKLKPGAGSEIATAQCLTCHSADYISTQPRLARAVWKTSVQKMKDKYGAPIPEDKVDVVVDYLVKTYGTETPKETKKQ